MMIINDVFVARRWMSVFIKIQITTVLGVCMAAERRSHERVNSSHRHASSDSTLWNYIVE